MINKWIAFYDFWETRACCVSSYKEISAMNKEQLTTFIDTKLRLQIEEKCDFQECNIDEFQVSNKAPERVYSFRKSNNIKVTTNLLE
jgi:hypothetical protein